MKLHKVHKLGEWLQGRHPMPAGAIPLASNSSGGVVCMLPSGLWIMWRDGLLTHRPPETQRAVMDVAINLLGGTAAAMAERLKVSPRTVEGWRIGRRIEAKKAMEMAELMASIE
jgi:hypothetical protein